MPGCQGEKVGSVVAAGRLVSRRKDVGARGAHGALEANWAGPRRFGDGQGGVSGCHSIRA